MGKRKSLPISALWGGISEIPDFPNAKCKGNLKALWDFQLNDREKLVARGRRHNKAIKLCRSCDHKDLCHSWAVDNQMQGVWGGVVLVPDGRTYLRCEPCGKPMIKSRYQKPPWGFRNRHDDKMCTMCHAYRQKKAEREKNRRSR